MIVTRLTMVLFLALLFSATSGCAVLNRENRPLLEGLDSAVKENGLADSTAAKVALAPLALTAGTAAVVVDMAVITPVRATGPAFDDTSDWVWKNPQGSEMRQVMLFLPKVAVTPVVFVSDWAFRSLFTTKF